MHLRVTRTGTASMAAMWDAYAEPGHWRTWAPQIRSVEATGPLRQGLEGTVTGLLGVRARFRVTDVDAGAGRWSWDVQAGPASLQIDHEVTDGRASVLIDGPAPAVLAYAPVARLALSRLVRLSAPTDRP